MTPVIHRTLTQPILSVLNFSIMPPNSNSKAKNDGQKLAIKKDKPEAGMIDEDGPIVDSPIAIDFEEGHPGGSQDVRASHFALTPLRFIGSNRTSLVRRTRNAKLQTRAPAARPTRQMSCQMTITLSRLFSPGNSHPARLRLGVELRERVRTYLYPAPCCCIFTGRNAPSFASMGSLDVNRGVNSKVYSRASLKELTYSATWTYS